MDLHKIYYQFIDEQLQNTNLTYSLLYLYALRFATDSKPIPKIDAMAEALHLLPSDVHSAWLFWVSKGLASLDGDEIRLNMHDQNKIKAKVADRDFAYICGVVSKEMGVLKPADMETLKYIQEQIKLPTHVLVMLINHATRDKGKKSMNYIEKIAIDWKEKGITTIEKAEVFIANANKGAVLKQEREAGKAANKAGGTSKKIPRTSQNFEPRPISENDDLEDFWLETLLQQAKGGE